VRVRVLGSAAGGGFPQWNCNCANCRGLRAGAIRTKARTQCSIAVSSSGSGDGSRNDLRDDLDDGSQWILLNASPDLRVQISSVPELAPKDSARGSSIAAVLLTDAELDHITGLLSLRENQPIELHCTRRVYEWVFEANPIFGGLIQPSRFRWEQVENRQPTQCRDSLSYEGIFVAGKVPTYVKTSFDGIGSTVGYIIADSSSKSSMLYVPAIKSISEELVAAASKCDCIFFDGSFWSDDEMERRGVGSRTASAMGHVPIDGPEGSLARLSHFRARKVYTHVNNTNPILDEASAERRAIENAGWEVAEDGMDFIL
jgi:pyrroloquinoline quinone biosynthesis protein B